MSIEEWARAIVGPPVAWTQRAAQVKAREQRIVIHTLARLSDPACSGSEAVLAQIRQRRESLRAGARRAEVAAIFGEDLAPEIQDGEEEGP